MSFFYTSSPSRLANETIITTTIFVLFLFVSFQTGFSRHPRYLLPVIPFVYIYIGKIAVLYRMLHRFMQFFCCVILLWIIISSLRIYPNSISYCNEIAGSPSNWPKYLLGSNIDAGQDLYRLREWHVKRGHDVKSMYITCGNYFPRASLGLTHIEEVPASPVSGIIVISVNELYQRSGKYDWLKTKKPTGMIGYSIWIFDIE